MAPDSLGNSNGLGTVALELDRLTLNDAEIGTIEGHQR